MNLPRALSRFLLESFRFNIGNFGASKEIGSQNTPITIGF